MIYTLQLNKFININIQYLNTIIYYIALEHSWNAERWQFKLDALASTPVKKVFYWKNVDLLVIFTKQYDALKIIKFIYTSIV